MVYRLVDIDADEEGLGVEDLSDQQLAAGLLRPIPRLQTFFDRDGVRPSYQPTLPVKLDHRGSRLLKRYLDQGRCDIGAHPHIWSTARTVEGTPES